MLNRKAIVLFSCTMLLVTACGKESDTAITSKEINTVVPTDAAVVTPPATQAPAVLKEPEDINYDQYIEGYAAELAIELKEDQHNVFSGTFGSEQVNVDIWPKADENRYYVQVEGDFHSEVMKFEMVAMENGALAVEQENSYYFMVLSRPEEESGAGELSGLFGEKNGLGEEPVEVNLKPDYVIHTKDREHMYSMGEDDEVRAFSQKVLDAVMIEDSETLADMVQYPLYLNGMPAEDENDTNRIVQSREQFIESSAELVFTPGFVQGMSESSSYFMFSNEVGIRIGTESNCVWISRNEKGKWVIISIYN